MAEAFSIDCQKCFATIRIKNPDLIGRKVACPKCGEAVRVRAPAGDDDEDEIAGDVFRISDEPTPEVGTAVSDEPTDAGGGSATEVRDPKDVRNRKGRTQKKRKKRVPRSDQDLSGVRTGIFLVFFQAMVWVALVLMAIGFLFAVQFAGIGKKPQAMWVTGIGVVFLLSYVIGVIGKVFCLKAPESVGREFITIALALEAIAFVMGLLTGAGVLTWSYAQLTANATGILGSIMFLWFLSDLALHIDREYLSDDALHIVSLGFATFGVALLSWGALFFLPAIVGAVLLLIPAMMNILIVVRYITLIVRLNNELRQQA